MQAGSSTVVGDARPFFHAALTREKHMFKTFPTETVTFHPKDGSRPLRAKVATSAGYTGDEEWFDLNVDNAEAVDGSPHRNFEVRARQAGPADIDKRGLFTKFPPGPDGAYEAVT
jgi:hypothetical protein